MNTTQPWHDPIVAEIHATRQHLAEQYHDKGDLKSRTALRLVRDWIDLRIDEIDEDWKLAQKGEQIKKIPPLE